MSLCFYFWNISYSYTLACDLAGPICYITTETTSHIHGNSLFVNAAADIRPCVVGTTRGEGEEVSEQEQEEDEERKSDASRRRYKQPKAASSISARRDDVVLCKRIFKNKFDSYNFAFNPQKPH